MPVTPPLRYFRLTPEDHSYNDHQKEDDKNKEHDAGSNDVGRPLLLLHLGPLLSAGTAAFMRLDPHRPRARKATHQTFARSHGSKQRTGGHAHGVADSISPSHQVTIVYHTAFPRLEIIFDTRCGTTESHWATSTATHQEETTWWFPTRTQKLYQIYKYSKVRCYNDAQARFTIPGPRVINKPQQHPQQQPVGWFPCFPHYNPIPIPIKNPGTSSKESLGGTLHPSLDVNSFLCT